MAQKSTSGSKTTVRRITATDDAPKKPAAKAAAKTETVRKQKAKSSEEKQIGYFRGAWHELKQVRWPTRSATWSLTAAVLIFTAIFVVLILLLDGGFNWIFNQILK